MIRSLVRRRALSATIVLMLALAIGANTAIYSVAKAVILTPLPFPNPDRVVHLFAGSERDRPGRESSFVSVRGGTFQDWRGQCHSFQSMAAPRMSQAILSGDPPAVVDSLVAGDRFFETLGIQPHLGRYFDAQDYATTDARVVVLSHRSWSERYNSDHDHRTPCPSRWSEPQLWMPLRWDLATKYSRVLWGRLVYARFREGVTLNQAQAEMELVASHIRAAHPDDYDHMSGRGRAGRRIHVGFNCSKCSQEIAMKWNSN